MERANMENSLQTEGLEKNAAPQAQRRRLLQTALAITGGGSLQALAPAGAFGRSGKPSSLQRVASPMQDAIKACLDCHSMCLHTAMAFCLERGGKHVEQQHFRLMLNCAELCQTSANFMLSDSPLHGRVCAVCAEACEACAKSCEQVGDMTECIEECLRCAKSCRTMA